MTTLKMGSVSLPYQSAGIVLITVVFLLWHGYGRFVFSSATSRKGRRRHPPVVPYWVPFLGHALPAAWDMPAFLASMDKKYGGMPLILRFGFLHLLFVFKPKHIVSLFNHSKIMNNGIYRDIAVTAMFGMPNQARRYIAADDSGLQPTPLRTSNVKPANRFLYTTHSSLIRYLSGPTLKPLARRYTDFLLESVSNPEMEHENWSTIPDLYMFLQKHMFESTVRSIFGEAILEMNPSFVQDFWSFDRHIPSLAKGCPRWLVPQAYAARDRCLAAVRRWHDLIRRHPYRSSGKEDDERWDAVHGDPIMRFRRDFHNKIPEMDPAAQAAEDLGFIWGSISNSVHMAFWLMHSILHDPQAMSRAHSAVSEHIIAVSVPTPLFSHLQFDASAMAASPYLSSLYTETLRLYSGTIVLRNVNGDDLELDNEWTIPKGSVVGLDSYLLNHKAEFWNCGTAEEYHLINTFWDRRHLYSCTVPGGHAEEHFSIGKAEGIFVPYGGGHNMCPGRHLAKQEILVTMAILISKFDLELVQSTAKVDWHSYGTGSLGVVGKTQCRIRKRMTKLNCGLDGKDSGVVYS